MLKALAPRADAENAKVRKHALRALSDAAARGRRFPTRARGCVSSSWRVVARETRVALKRPFESDDERAGARQKRRNHFARRARHRVARTPRPRPVRTVSRAPRGGALRDVLFAKATPGSTFAKKPVVALDIYTHRAHNNGKPPLELFSKLAKKRKKYALGAQTRAARTSSAFEYAGARARVSAAERRRGARAVRVAAVRG